MELRFMRVMKLRFTIIENKFDEDRLMVKFRKRDRSNLDIGKFDKKLL